MKIICTTLLTPVCGMLRLLHQNGDTDMTTTTYSALGIPSSRELRTCGYDDAIMQILQAHNRELKRHQARASNWGWSMSDTGIASKTSKGILETSMRAGWMFHQWTTNNGDER